MASSTDNEDRLSQIEAVLASIAERQSQTQAQVDSNARGVAAIADSFSTLGADIREGFARTRAEIEQETTDVVSMIGSLAEDTERASQSVETLAAEGKQQREANAAEHSDFRALMHSTLAEVARIFRELRSA